MPQTAIFSDNHLTGGFRLQFEWEPDKHGGYWQVSAQARPDHGQWSTFWSGKWSGVMCDFVSTLGSEAFSAWMFGEPSDVRVALTTTHKAARAHAAVYGRAMM
jgi:hypothetical protein